MSDAQMNGLLTSVWFSLFVIGGYRASCACTKGSYSISSTKSEFVFMAPIDLVLWLIGAMGGSYIYAVALVSFVPVSSFMQHPLSTLISTIPWLIVGLLILGFYQFVKLWFQRNFILKLDRGNRTYQTFVAATASERRKSVAGQWSDIAGICMVRGIDPGGEGNWPEYLVQVQWHNPAGQYSILGGFEFLGKEQAQAFAAQIAQELELPLLPTPGA